MMGPTPARPAMDDDEPEAFSPSGEASAAFPDLDAYVDLVTELEEILRGAAGEPAAPDPEGHAGPEPVETFSDPIETVPPPAAVSPSAHAVPLRTRARSFPPVPQDVPAVEAQPDRDGGRPGDAGFWQVDDQSWASSPAWREPRRGGRVDLFIIGALVVLIAGGGAYSAIRLGDGGNASLAENGIVDNASRAEAGLGVPFAPIGRAGLLRADPTLPVPSLDAAVAGAEVAPLPVIVEPPVEATAPIFLADALATDPAPAAAAPETAAAPGAVGGPLVPFDPVELTAGVPATTTTTVTTWVNMRAGPDNGAAVVMVVSPETTVTVRSCDYWCSVTVDGRNGYIFQDFLVAHP